MTAAPPIRISGNRNSPLIFILPPALLAMRLTLGALCGLVEQLAKASLGRGLQLICRDDKTKTLKFAENEADQTVGEHDSQLKRSTRLSKVPCAE